MDEKDTTLSKEEMDALFGEEESLSQNELNAINEVYKRVFDASCVTLSTLLKRDVRISPPVVKVESLDHFKLEVPKEVFVAEAFYDGAFKGVTYLAITREVGAIIADLMMGGDGTFPPEEINELYLGALGEAVSQMMNTSATALTEVIGKGVTISTPKINLVNLSEEEIEIPLLKEGGSFLKIISDLRIDTLVDRSPFTQLLSISLGKVIAQRGLKIREEEPLRGRVHPVQFATLKPGVTREVPSNIDLLMDVPMRVTVELGRTSMLVKDILKLGAGSVVELDKMAGEPVDFLVNGKLIARGGVVVIDENFGIKITDIISPTERI